MSLTTLPIDHEYEPGDAQAPEAIPFQFLTGDDVFVEHVDGATGARTELVAGDDYVIGGDGPAGTGTITATADWPEFDSFYLRRRTEIKQDAAINPHQALPSADVKRQLTRMAMAVQEDRGDIDDTRGRSWLLPRGETGGTLPPAADRAGKFRAWDADGNETEASGTGSDPDFRTDAAQADGSALFGHSDNADGAVARSGATVLREAPITPGGFGIAMDGAFDAGDAARWAKLLAAAAAQKREIQLTEGHAIIAATLNPTAGQVIRGAGKGRSTLEFRNPAGTAVMNGIAMKSGMLIDDFDIIVDKAGETWCSALGFSVDGMRDIIVGCDIIGANDVSYVGQYAAVATEGCDLSDITFRNQKLRYLTFASLLRSNSNVAEFDRINFIDLDMAYNVDGLNINAPGVFIADTDGTATIGNLDIPTSWLKVGRRVYSPTLPAGGSEIVAVGASTITLSDIPSGGADTDVKFSAGHWRTSNLRVTSSFATQFPFAFAGPRLTGISGEVTGHDNDYALIHGEDGWSQSRLRVVGWANNRLPGTPGSSMAATAAIDLIGDCHDLAFDVDLDLDQQDGGSPVGFCAQASSPQVSNGLIEPPRDLTFNGTVRGGTGRIAVIAIECSGIVNNVRARSPGGGSVMDPVFSMPGTDMKGSPTVHNPGVLFEANENTNMSGLDRLLLTGSMADFSEWCAGPSAGRTSIVVASRTIWSQIPFTADVTATWQSIAPTILDFFGHYDFKFRENGTANGAVVIARTMQVEDSALTPTDVKTYAGGASDPVPGAGSPAQTDDHMRFDSGRWQLRVYHGTTANGFADIGLYGPLRAKAA